MEGLISEGAYKWRDLYLRGPVNGETYICDGLQQEWKKHFKTCYSSADQNTFCINLVFNKLQKFIMNWIHFNTFGTEAKGGLYLGVCVCVCVVGVIRNFHISHNAPYLPPKILHNLCFSFLLSITAISREIENNAYVKFEGLVRCKLWEMWSGVSWDVFFVDGPITRGL